MLAAAGQLLISAITPAVATRPAEGACGPLACRIHEGGPTPLIAIHGSPGSQADFATLSPELCDEFTVYEVEMPGFGESPPVPGHWGYAASADALAEAIFAMGLADPKPVVLGFSWGGGVAIALGAEYPELVSGLVLLAGVGVPDGLHTGSWYTETLRTLAAGPLVLGYPGALVGSWFPFGQRQAFWAHFLGGDTRQAERRLRATPVPVVALHDPEDTVVGISGAALHAATAPQGTLHFYSGGHGLIYQGGATLAPLLRGAMAAGGLL